MKIYGDNFQTFFERSIEPVDAVGEIDEEDLQKRTDAMWAEHAPTIEPAFYQMSEEGKLVDVEEENLPEDFSPAIKISSASELSSSDYILGEIPLLSALRGPIGEIIDVLLSVLGDSGSTVISIPTDLIETIKGLFEVLEPIIGIVKDFDLDSPLKSIVQAIANEFPFMAEFKDYLNIILKALFNFRGDITSILEIVGELITALLPDSVPQMVKDFIGQILGTEDGLWDVISNVVSEGKGVFDTIFSFFTKNTLQAFLNKTLAATLGMTSGQVSTLLPRIISFVEATIDFLSGKDFVKFIQTIGTDLLGSILSVSGLSDAVDKVMSIVKMGMSAFDLLDDFDTTSFLEFGVEMLEEIVGPSNIPGGAEDLAKQMMAVIKSFQEGAFSDVNGFKSQISSILDSETSGATQAIKDVIRDTMTMLTGFFNEAFDKNQLPDLFEIAADLINEVIGGGDAAQVIEALNSAVKPIMGLIALVSDSEALKNMVSKTVSNFVAELSDAPTMIKNVLSYLDVEDVISGLPGSESVLDTAGQIVGGIITMIQGIKGQSFQGIMQSVLMAAGSLVGSLPAFDDVPIDAFLKLLQSFFPDAFGISKEDMPTSTEVINEILGYAEGLLGVGFDESMLEDTLEFFMDIKDIFTNGVKWLLGKVFDWLSGLINPVLDDIEDTIEGLFAGLDDLLGFSGKFPIGLGDWSLFDLEYALGIKANFAIDLNPIFDMIVSMIFDAREVFSTENIGDFFKTILSFFEISPQFYAELGIGGFDTEKNALMKTMLTSLGLKLSFEGSARFVVNLFTFRGGMFEWDNFFKIVEWSLHIKIHIGKVFTLLDFLTAGVGGGALNAVAEFLGLDMITVEVYFEIAIDIVKKAATAVAPEVSSMTLTIIFGVAVHIPIELIIVAITIDGTLEIILTFFQDFADPAPMKITLRLIFTIKVKFRFLMFSDSAKFTWEPGGPWDLSPNKGEAEYNESGVGFDTDGDGLGDPFEDATPGLDKNKADTDDDGANDKLEFQTMKTDPSNPDSDGDGLLDGREWDLGTNPMREDTDWDDVDDYKEVEVYGTNPLEQDSDGDGLTDAYEIYTKLDISNVTPTVTEIIIGGESYNDRTDPLNPDTDGDGLLDGDEGPMGAYYGDPSLYNDTEDTSTETGWAMDPDPLIFNGGFTHPLDADTDDDSALQLYNGVVDSQAYLFLKDMNDGAEVAGFTIIVYDEEGEPENKHVFTNPCNPDTDGDTGVTDRTPQPGMWLNSDGYELAQTPPTDPTDGDSDDDGILDGLEGVLNPYSNHTNPNDPDTDDDGLFDLQEILLGSDPREQDTDGDMISDGDEFYTFFTNPNVWDSDFDGLGDGEEVYFWHTNPMTDDSDADMIYDGDEVLVYGSDPMDEDSDNDGLTDYEEIFVYYTDPFDYDTDDDLLSDGEEIELYDCDPLSWDTDGDSITEPNELGEMTFPLNDYQEVNGFYIYKMNESGFLYQEWVYTNVTESDTDEDGLSDAMELYLASGIVPWLDPIPLDPTNKDTDHDFIPDGAEMAIENVSGLIYPYRAMTLVFRYNTSPVDRDSDDDLLIDYQEVMIFNTNPANNDTDNDTITDWWETWVYNTSALYNDTDGDELYDFEETLVEVWPYGPWPPSNWSLGMEPAEMYALAESTPFIIADESPILRYVPSQAIYTTLATDPDCDDDWLPDGAEVNFYHTDPLNDDSDGDSIPDTLEFDTDFDGLPDGIEFELKLYRLGGGIFDQDSDGDGVSDGTEYYVYGTDPASVDSDGDGYPDGLEIAIGTDPLAFTSETDYEQAITISRSEASMDILMPQALVTNAQTVDVNVLNFTPFVSMEFRYNTSSGWSDNFTMSYNPATMTWTYTDMYWNVGTYELQVFAVDYFDEEYMAIRTFTVGATPTYPEPISPLVYLAIGMGVGVFAILFLLYGVPMILKYRKKRRGEEPGEKPPELAALTEDIPEEETKESTKKKSSSTKKEPKDKTSKKKKSKKGGSSLAVMFIGLTFLGMLLVGSFGYVPSAPMNGTDEDSAFDQYPAGWEDLSPDLQSKIAEMFNPTVHNMPSDQDIGQVLGDRANDYAMNYEPWRSKAAIHAIAYDEDTGFLALGGGYLYDNQIHVFRLNTQTKLWDKVWDTGDSVFQSDVMALDFGDTDLNNLIEIVAGCSDGFVYVFEQRHLYDPYANMENQFDHVWTSPDMFRVFSLKVDDVDRDYRPDIIAGGWDGKLHLFEYDKHSGYPFVEEHWITYDEVATLDVGEKIYSLETGDTNYNGLPEIICGSRDGTVYVFENDGLSIMINGQPFPLIYDNHYYLNWTSENYTWTPIQSMAVGELDNTPGDEIVLVAQGQGVFTLEWNAGTKTYDYQKVYREFKPWETFGFWGLDNYVDRVIYAHNVTYHDPVNITIIENEPIQYVWNEGLSIFEPDASVYPFNSGMAGPVHHGGVLDGNFSNFNAFLVGVDNATAILDFGLDEEGTGGANSNDDLSIYFKAGTDLSHLSSDFWFYISQDGTDWELIPSDRFNPGVDVVGVDVDTSLSQRRWDWFRYAKIMVNNSGFYQVNGIELEQVYNTLTDALSITIGPLRLDGMSYLQGLDEPIKIIVGSVTGEINAIMYNSTTSEYDVIYDSGDDSFYTFGANIWDMVYVGNEPDVPTWNWQYGMPWTPDVATTYNSWSYATLNPWLFGSSTFNYLMGTNEGQIRAFSVPDVVPIASPPELDLTTQAYFNNINVEIPIEGWLNVSVEAPLFVDGYDVVNEYSVWPFIALGLFNPSIPIESIPLTVEEDAPSRATVVFYYRDSDTQPFNHRINLVEIDTTGELTELINLAKVEPKLDFADFDGDGDLDFVVSNGYVHMARNMWYESGALNFTYVRGYFNEINAKETSKIWGQPELVDIDSDGDLDIILSYANKMGATCWINEGTAEDPVWVEDKKIMSNPLPETNMKYQNFTDIRIVPKLGGYLSGYTLERWYEYWGWDMDFNWTIAGYREWNQRMGWAAPEFDTTESYIVASYPRVAQLDFSLMSSAADGWELYNNIGFHVHESWSNDDDLEEWTLSIDTGDIDGDGKGELIVGDYDNNVYVFEHLTMNNYKRMFRSFDLNHTTVTDVSPYLYEDLEGISGDFNRRIWDHAKHLVADVDLDRDGLKELVVASDLQIYIFEDAGLYGGDLLTYQYSIDLRDSVWADRYAFVNLVTEITAMAAGDDLDYNGELELAVAAGPYLFIYNIPVGDFDGFEDKEFFVTSPSLEGRYYLVGNPEFSEFRYYYINAMTLCDTDQDGYKEVLIGGVEDTRLIRQNGFVQIYECQGGTFYKVWEAPSEVTYWNPVSALALDDQDMDGSQEIVIGHTNGFDLWEWIPGSDSQYQKVEYVTASPNYPIVPLRSTAYDTGDFPNAITTERSIKDMAHGVYGAMAEGILMLYENGQEIWFQWYNETADDWTWGVKWMDQVGLAYTTNLSTIVAETRPSVLIPSTGDIYASWEVWDSGGQHYIALCWGDVSAGVWHGPILWPDTYGIQPIGTTFYDRYYPSLFEYNSSHVGIVFMYDAYNIFFGSVYGRVGAAFIANDLSGAWTNNHPNFNDMTYFQTHDVDVVKLNDGNFSIAMSAVYTRSGKADHDVWVVTSIHDFNFTGANPHQATTSYDDEMFVSIDELESEEVAIVVTYETIGVELEDRIGMVSSITRGREWSAQETLNTIPRYISRTEMPGGYVYYYIEGSPFPIYQLSIFSPTVIGTDESGFMYSATFNYKIYIPPGVISDKGFWYCIHDIVYGINPQSDWTMNHLRDVIDLDVGDTDSDGRREVVVGFEDQFAVYEMKHSTNGTGFMSYEEAWLSNSFDNPITGVSVYDTNGNGWEDIGVSSKRGDVYIFEYIDPSEGPISLWYSEQLWSYPTSGDQNPLIDGLLYPDLLQAYDLDQDEREEIILASYDLGIIEAIDEYGSQIWINADDATDGFSNVILSDLDLNGISEIICTSKDSNLYVFDITTGDLVWSYIDAVNPLVSVITGDLTGDINDEIVFTDDSGYIHVLNYTGGLLSSYSTGGTYIFSMLIGNFTNAPEQQLAYVTYNETLIVMNPLNGSIYYKSPDSTATPYAGLVPYDFNHDGFEDLIYAYSWVQSSVTFGQVHILDVLTSSIDYNSTINIGLTHEFYVYDFDGDSSLEILSATLDQGLYLEEMASTNIQWHYNLTGVNHMIWDVDFGNAGGTGGLDIFIAASVYLNDVGIVAAIDGKNGIPLWFNFTGGDLGEVIAANVSGSEIDTLVVWDMQNEQLITVSGVEPTELVVPPSYENHEVYWELEVNSVYGVWVDDIFGTSLDEIVVAGRNTDGKYSLALVDGLTMQVEWNITFDSKISDVQIGYINDWNTKDLAVWTGLRDLYVIDGVDGQALLHISALDTHEIRGVRVADFSDAAGYDYEEIAVLIRQWSGGSEVYIEWYDGVGNALYDTKADGFTSTATSYRMAVGNFRGGTTADIAMGASIFSARIYNGGNGALFTTVTPTSTYGLAAGDFNGDGSADLAVMDSGSDIHMFEFIGGGSITLNFATGMVREFFAGDLYNNDSVDEVVVNLEREGAIAYSFSGTEVWRYNAPLVMGGKDTRIIIEDMNADGWSDLVLTNKEYINVVDGSTARLLWHYWKEDLSSNFDPCVGHFYSTSSRDVLCYGNDMVYIVAHEVTAPPVPPPAPLFQTEAVHSPLELWLLVGLGCFQLIIAASPHSKRYLRFKKREDT
ncbi:MAG: FG-GAP-like repeat-containing protein [Candidatus Thorarchaeota archaeon]